MKFVKYVLALCVFAGTMGVAAPLMAADAPKAVAAIKEAPKDLLLKGDAKCTGCHDETDDSIPSMLELRPSVLSIGKTKHGTKADGRTPTCTSCHGESEKHANHKGKDKPPHPDIWFAKKTNSTAAERNSSCLTCHQKDSKRHLWAGSAHETRDVACSDCHQVHAARDKVRDKRTQADVCFTCHKEQRTQINRPSRHPIPEGKMTCSDCHNAHGSSGPKLMKRDSTNDTCYTCHMEKRGPFVHNHEPVNEDCSNCHNPHGTVAESMLKIRAPMLCHQCHTPHGGTALALVGQTGYSPSATSGKSPNYTQARSCLNCHTQVHGSNNPSATNPTPQFNFR